MVNKDHTAALTEAMGIALSALEKRGYKKVPMLLVLGLDDHFVHGSTMPVEAIVTFSAGAIRTLTGQDVHLKDYVEWPNNTSERLN